MKELFARVLLKLKPPPKLTVSEWADKYRRMSPEASAGTGRWHTDNAPYQRAVMDAIGDPHIRMVVVKTSSQIGKTEIILNTLGYAIDYTPAPTLVMQPTVEMGQTFSKDRLAPMIRDTPELRKKVDAKSRFSGNLSHQDRRAELCLCSCGCSRHEGPLEGLIRRQSRRKTI